MYVPKCRNGHIVEKVRKWSSKRLFTQHRFANDTYQQFDF